MTAAPRILIVVSADAARDAKAGPRRDYAVLASILRATVLDRTALARAPLSRALGLFAGQPAAQAWMAFRRRSRYDVIITDGEHVGIPLALLLRLSRARVEHITIGHRLSAPKKRVFFTVLRAQERMDRIIVHSRQQFDYAVAELGIVPTRLALMPYQVDAAFWRPSGGPEEPLIVSAGLEYRDYATFFRAVAGLPVRVVIGASSPWSRHRTETMAPPPNVEVGTFDYIALRDLYQRASLVVVPLTEADNQAGVTTILEAMAVAKPVIVSQSLGQTDVIEDRRSGSRGVPRPRRTSLLRLIAYESGVNPEPTGFYVPPGDPAPLRRAISYLMDHPDERAQLGLAGRRTVEELLTVDLFAERMRAIVLERSGSAPGTTFLQRAWHG